MTEAAQAVEETAPETVEATEPETMFEGVETPEPEVAQDTVINTPENPDARPDWLPEKFKTPEELVKSYNELGAKIREKNEPPEAYELKLPEGIDNLSEDDMAVFKDVGLNNDQAQKLTDYLYETIVPALSEAKVGIERDRLAMEWGVESNSQEFTAQLANIKAWANQNLPDAVTTELARSATGIQTIANLMNQGTAQQRAVGTTAQQRPSSADLQALMQDERYWKGDEDYKKYVADQFKLAYD